MSQHTPSLSFEVFPPNPEVGNAKLLRALANMQELAPHFISVTIAITNTISKRRRLL